jgi:hypothetical protein
MATETLEDAAQIGLALNAFRKEEFEQTIVKAKSIAQLLEEIDQEKEKICAMESEYDPRIFHFAHQQLSVIESDLRHQLYSLQRLRGDLERHDVIQLEKDRSYQERCRETERLNRVVQFFIPYILICTIYLRHNQEMAISRQVSKQAIKFS